MEESVGAFQKELLAIADSRYEQLGKDLDSVIQKFRVAMDADQNLLIADYVRTTAELSQVANAYNHLLCHASLPPSSLPIEAAQLSKQPS
ncbi:hypothetical protein BGZ99_001702, partial [Dissophora globulifera]